MLNRDTGYAFRPADLEWLPGARDAVRLLNESGYLVVVVTNQSGVGRGYYSESDVHAFHDRIQSDLAELGACINAFYFCPFHPEASVEGYRVADHPDRKPNPGMILRALHDLPIRLEGSFLIGDRESDLAAAAAAGLPAALFDGEDLLGLVRRLMAQNLAAGN